MRRGGKSEGTPACVPCLARGNLCLTTLTSHLQAKSQSNLPQDPPMSCPHLQIRADKPQLFFFFFYSLLPVATREFCFLFFFKFIYLFIYLFLAVLGLRFCARAFSSCGKRGPLFIAVRGPLTIAASLVAEHRLQTRRLSSCGSRA